MDADQYVHNVTSTKQNLNSAARGTANSGLLVLADVNATSRYWHYYDPSGGGGGGGDTTAPIVSRDFNGDGRADLLARDSSGVLWVPPGQWQRYFPDEDPGRCRVEHYECDQRGR